MRGAVFEAHKLCPFQAQLHQFCADFLAVVVVALIATVAICLVYLTPQLPVAAILQDRIARCPLHVEHPFPRLSLCRSHCRRPVDIRLWKSLKVFKLVDGDEGVVGLMQEIAGELYLECGNLLIELAQTSFVGIIEVCSVALKSLVYFLHHFLLLMSEVSGIDVIIDLLHATEESRVHVYVIIMLGEGRRHFLG